MKRFPKTVAALLLLPLLLLLVAAWRLRPRMTEKEAYNHFFPKERFLAKLASPIPSWMEEQLEADFRQVAPVKKEALEKAYSVIQERIREPIFLYHYRILDNQLYKYVPPGTHFSYRDSYYEKALKTLLSHVKLPDLDFLLCPMDGIPEAIVPSDFYVMEDPKEQVPLFGQAKLEEPLTRQIILIPDQLSLAQDWHGVEAEILALNAEIPWTSKQGKAFWRGRISDDVGPGSRQEKIRYTPRLLLCLIGKEWPNLIDAASDYWPHLMDLVQKEGLPQAKNFASKREHLQYKYQLVLDGNMCTYPGYQWRLLSNSLALKQNSNQIQWFYSALKPYTHYLPIANDMSDLPEKVKWAEEHEPEVLQMIAQARQFALDHLRYEDGYRYLYLALQKYKTYQQIDFKALKKETRRDPNWVNIHYRKRLAFYKLLSRLRQAGTNYSHQPLKKRNGE